MKTSIYLSLFAICISIFTGCATDGPAYHDVKASLARQPGKGLALIYFKYGIGASASKWHIYANDQLLTDKFKRGSFYSYQANPGDVSIYTTWNTTYVNVLPSLLGKIPKDQPTIRVAPNQTYYITMGIPFFGREKLTQVSKEEGEEGIKDCHWLNPQ